MSVLTVLQLFYRTTKFRQCFLVIFFGSSDDEFQANQREAQEAGNSLLHQLLYQKYSAQTKRNQNSLRSIYNKY